MGMVLDFQKRRGMCTTSRRKCRPTAPRRKAPRKDTGRGARWAPPASPTTRTSSRRPTPRRTGRTSSTRNGPTGSRSRCRTQACSTSLVRAHQLYGPDYWKKFAELKPRAFDSYVQQYDRLVNQQDKVIHTAQYSGYLEWKAKGAPVAFNVPPDGMPGTPEAWGLVAGGPHPNAARLFLDWFLSLPGQKATEEGLFLHSMRNDAPTGRRPPDQQDQIVAARRLAGLPEEPHRVPARVGQDDRAALTRVRVPAGS